MARPEGFEPPTNGFGSHYSIRLSYGRMSVDTSLGLGVWARRGRSIAELGAGAHVGARRFILAGLRIW